MALWTAPAARQLSGVPTVFDLNTGARLFRLEEVVETSATFTPAVIIFSKDSKRLASLQVGLDSHKGVTIWDSATGRALMQFTPPDGRTFSAGTLEFSADGHRLTYKTPGTQVLPGWTMTWDATPRAQAQAL